MPVCTLTFGRSVSVRRSGRVLTVGWCSRCGACLQDVKIFNLEFLECRKIQIEDFNFQCHTPRMLKSSIFRFGNLKTSKSKLLACKGMTPGCQPLNSTLESKNLVELKGFNIQVSFYLSAPLLTLLPPSHFHRLGKIPD